jgi:hypothetical protein
MLELGLSSKELAVYGLVYGVCSHKRYERDVVMDNGGGRTGVRPICGGKYGGAVMKKVIKKLEDVKKFLLGRYAFGLEEGIDNKPLKQRIDMLSEAILELQSPHPRWETPEQWEKRTGERWPNNGAVYVLYENNTNGNKWVFCESYYYAASEPCEGNRLVAIICATEAGPPPDAWEPEEAEK